MFLARHVKQQPGADANLLSAGCRPSLGRVELRLETGENRVTTKAKLGRYCTREIPLAEAAVFLRRPP